MSDNSDRHPQLPGLETTPPEEFDVAKIAGKIAEASKVHQPSIAARYLETASRFDGAETESTEDNNADVAQNAGDTAVADVVSIDHLPGDPTPEQKAKAMGGHPSNPSRIDEQLKGKSRTEQIRIIRGRLAQTQSPEEKAAERRRLQLEDARRRASDPSAVRRLPPPPVPPSRPRGR